MPIPTQLTPEQQEILRAEIQQPQYAGLTDQPVSEALNAPTEARVPVDYVPTTTVITMLIQQGVFAAIAAAAQTNQWAGAVLFALQNPHFSQFDPSNQAIQAAIAGLRAYSLVDDATVAAWQLITTRPASRAEVLFGAGTHLDHLDVACAREA